MPRDTPGVQQEGSQGGLHLFDRKVQRLLFCHQHNDMPADWHHSSHSHSGHAGTEEHSSACFCQPTTMVGHSNSWEPLTEFFGNLFTKWRKTSAVQSAHLYAYLLCCFWSQHLRAISEEHGEETAWSLYSSFPFSLTTLILLHYFQFLGFDFFHTVPLLTFLQINWAIFHVPVKPLDMFKT